MNQDTQPLDSDDQQFDSDDQQFDSDDQQFDSDDQPEPQGPVNPLQDELDTLRSEMALLKTDALRERADLENQRKRLARDVEQARKFANEKLLGELLPVFDSLDAGLTAAGIEPSPLRDGLDLTYKQLLKVAADNGLTIVDPAGQPFDPDHHQAISQTEAPEGMDPGSVVQVFQKGYLLNGRLLRPALVAVARQD